MHGPPFGSIADLLSIEFTRDCPLRWSGCYAFEAVDFGGTKLRQPYDLQGDRPVSNVLAVIDENKPFHVALVEEYPPVLFSELELLLPQVKSPSHLKCQ
jgi:hypothetical protein